MTPYTPTEARGIPEGLVRSLIAAHPLHTSFIETGTHAGWTIDTVKDKFKQILTVELSEHHFNTTRVRFQDCDHITFYKGSSRHKMHEMLSDLDGRKAIIWLDAHYSGGDTAQDTEGDCPVLDELKAIKESGVKDHIILIDDAVDFTGGVYPTPEELMKAIRDINPDYKFELLKERRGIFIARP